MMATCIKHGLRNSIIRPAILAGLLFVAYGNAQWKVDMVDAGHGGKHAALAFDGAGNGHAVFVDEANHSLRYAFWDQRLNRWFVMPVDGNCGGYAALALDSGGRPHVSYLAAGGGKVKYAFWDGAKWIVQALALTSRLAEYYTSIAIDGDGRPVIAYYEVLDAESPEYSLRLRTVRRTGEAWEIHTVDAAQGSGKFNSIAVSPGGRLAIGYANVKDEDASLRYAEWDGAAWKPEILLGERSAYYCRSVAMLLDSAGTPHLTYADVAARQMRYATKRDGKWVVEVVNSVVREGYPDRNGIALDGNGNPYVSFYDAGAGMLKVAHRAAGKWRSEVVSRDFSGFTSAIQISGGEIFVVYFDMMNNGLRCARRPLPAGTTISGGG